MNNDIVWDEETQQFITVPDGDVATHKEIKEYIDEVYGTKVGIKWI